MFCYLPLPQLLPPMQLVVSLQDLGLGSASKGCGVTLVAGYIAVSGA